MDKNGEKKEKRLEVKLPYSLYHKLAAKQIEIYNKTKKKPSIAFLIRDAILKIYK